MREKNIKNSKWNVIRCGIYMKVTINTIAVGSARVVEQRISKHIKIPENNKFDMILKIALLSTAHILRYDV